jgi:hypothetical protein
MSEERFRPDTFPFPGSSSHPLQPGTTVTVITLIEGRAPFIESRGAVVIAPAPGPHHYLVRVPGDPQEHDRFVHSAYQEDPDGTLVWMLELWRASYEPALHDEFFPDHPQTKGV